MLWFVPKGGEPLELGSVQIQCAMLEHLEKEKAHLESLGYSIGLLGDFNARIKPGPNFQFDSYPHEANNNGMLVTELAERNQLYCLYEMEWNGKKEE